ncbi:hypothetical protein ACFR9U_16140 [Halorientalis brevis]|uniref:Uncharacterized protein n=1 Tax=Halorientalis brevis TaxID=1126241 RepID=A0ABD6CF69_9EURY|nr:hypothetical protein [Halorientalis brevis]
MSQSEQLDVDLDVISKEMLHALEQHDGAANTSEIRKFLGIDSRTKINYRINEYLVPQGLVSTHQPDPEPGNIPAKELSITEKGEQALDQIAREAEINRDVAERIARLEEQVQSLRDENQDLREQMADTGTQQSSSTDASQSEIDDLQSQVANLAMELEDLKDDPLFQSNIRSELDAVRTGTLAMRDYLFDNGAEDDIVELTGKYAEKIEKIDKS